MCNREAGDELDINAAIDAKVAIRMGEQPNPCMFPAGSAVTELSQDCHVADKQAGQY